MTAGSGAPSAASSLLSVLPFATSSPSSSTSYSSSPSSLPLGRGRRAWWKPSRVRSALKPILRSLYSYLRLWQARLSLSSVKTLGLSAVAAILLSASAYYSCRLALLILWPHEQLRSCEMSSADLALLSEGGPLPVVAERGRRRLDGHRLSSGPVAIPAASRSGADRLGRRRAVVTSAPGADHSVFSPPLGSTRALLLSSSVASPSSFLFPTASTAPSPPAAAPPQQQQHSLLPASSASSAASLAAIPRHVKGLLLTVAVNNILLWSPSRDPLHPNYAFVESTIPFLHSLLSSPRYVVHLVAVAASDHELAQIQNLLSRTARLTQSGLDPRRILFCDSSDGKAAIVQRIAPHTHVDFDDAVIERVAHSVKRVVRVVPRRIRDRRQAAGTDESATMLLPPLPAAASTGKDWFGASPSASLTSMSTASIASVASGISHGVAGSAFSSITSNTASMPSACVAAAAASNTKQALSRRPSSIFSPSLTASPTVYGQSPTFSYTRSELQTAYATGEDVIEQLGNVHTVHSLVESGLLA